MRRLAWAKHRGPAAGENNTPPPPAELADTCDTKGACSNQEAVQCTPFVCEGDACGEGPCEGDEDCAAEFRCEEGDCVARDTTQCSDDRTRQLNPDGTEKVCAPYVCSGIVCLEQCDSSVHCRPGYVCDGVNRCRSAGGGGGDDGSCSFGPSGGARGGAWLVVGIFLVLGRGRRAARRRPRPEFLC